MGEQADLSSTPATSQVQPDPKNMPETAFVIAFCVKFMEALNKIYFWPEVSQLLTELDAALSSNEENPLLEKLHRLFMRNLLNLKALPERRHWMKKLSEIISDKIENQEDFYLDHNPLKRVNDNYYALGVRDKVMILQYLVSWQLVGSNKIRELIQEQHKGVSEEEIKPLEVEVLGEDTKESKYYYLGIGARIYRETLVPESGNSSLSHIKWEAISTTIDDLKNFASDRNEIDPSRSEKEKLLYTKIVNQVIPYLEEVAKDKDREVEEKKRRATEREAQKEIERLRQLKAIEQMHNNVEILPTRTRVRRPQSTPQSTPQSISITTTNNSNMDSHDNQSVVNTTKDSSNTVKAELKDSMSSSKEDGEDISSTSAKESNHDTLNKYNNDIMDNQSTYSKSSKSVSNKPRKNNKEKTSKSKKSSKDGSDETKKKNSVRKNSKSAKKSAPIDTTIIESVPTDYVKSSVNSYENMQPEDAPIGNSSVTENATYEHHELGPHKLGNIVIPEKTAFASDTTISSSSPSKAVVCIGNQPIDNVKPNEPLKTVSKGRGRPRKDKNAVRAPYTKVGKGRGRQKKSTTTDASVRDGQDSGINKGVPGEITFSISNSEGVQPWNNAPPTILNNTISATMISDIVTNTSSDTNDKQFGSPSQSLNISGFSQSQNVTGIANQVNVTVPTIDDNGTRSGEVVDSSQNVNHSSNENSITSVFNAPTIETIADEVRLKSSKMTLDNLLTYEPNSGALHSEFLSTGNQAFTPTTNIPQNKSTTEIDHSGHPLITKIASLITPVETDTETTKLMVNNSIDNVEPNELEEHNVNSDSNFWRTSVASLLNTEKIRDNNDVGLTVSNGNTDHLSVTRSSINSNIQPNKLSIDTNIVDKRSSKRHQTRSTRPNSQARIVESINTSNVDPSGQSTSDNKKRRQPSDDLWYERPLTRNQAKAAAMNDVRLVDAVNGTKRKEEDRQQNDHELPERPKKRKRRFLTETEIDDSIGIFVAVDSKGNIDIINDKEILSQPPPEGDTEKHIYFQPGPVGFLKLDTSLKHSFFQEDEVFGETDSELSSCGSVSSIDTD
ncbi:13594_t:CDS:2 [Cetraspora pellucida]|uniref:13594_t:CDS:1 n=1 Tax=Cetraspora pellucida TaxID=1433469 RepID=A0A9N9ARL7_9GLOM|nr:13594_t:CDS:2 [Cetraspora pellucida]